jgi:hypothetical protein
MPLPLRALPALVALCLAVSASRTHAEETTDASLRAELAALRAEVALLRAEVDAIKVALGSGLTRTRVALAPAVARQEPALPVPDPRVELLQAQVAELAQVKVESASRMPVKLFGLVHTHAFANVGEANWLDIPNIVPAPQASGLTGTFGTALRQTRLGVHVDGPTFASVRTRGTVAMDFFGGIPNFQTGQVMGLPRLLVAFARLEGEKTALHVGQDHMVLAPRDPSSLAAMSFPGLFRSGNLYLRAPQVTVERALTPGLRLAGGVMSPIAGDAPEDQFRFVPPALAGERARHPAFQARLQYARGAMEDVRRANVGLSGHWGRERFATRTDEAWAGAFDVALRRDWFGAAGEVFTGENLDAFGGGTGLPARSSGGWGELQLYPTTRLRFNAGGGIDRLRGDLASVARRRTRSAYGNVMFAFTPELEASFEYWWLGTAPGTGAERRNQHLDWVLVYRF